MTLYLPVPAGAPPVVAKLRNLIQAWSVIVEVMLKTGEVPALR